jgi:hypothetical protein
MSSHNCGSCQWRMKYEEEPRSFWGRLWRFHIKICPGWKSYYASLPPAEKGELKARYKLKA